MNKKNSSAVKINEIFDLKVQKERLLAFQEANEFDMEIKDINNDLFLVTLPNNTLDDDIVLTKATRLQLDEGIAKIRFHNKIYNEWNFGSVDKQGKNVILNFYGAPGTGKTLAADAFAGSLQLPIIKLGIAELESKFMGETSKNIQAVFKQGAEQGAVLFFDEADTLLGKRLSSVTQGIDNEVNAMRSTLLIELEKFDGIVIFATNFAKNYDEAFRSRISHHVLFELPDEPNRRALWDKMLVPEIPLSSPRCEIIEIAAGLSDGFSGRDIRNCMRLALPKAILESEEKDTESVLKIEHIEDVIKQMKLAKKNVANTTSNLTETEQNTAKSLLGLKNNKG